VTNSALPFNQADLLVSHGYLTLPASAHSRRLERSLVAAIREAGHKNVHYLRSIKSPLNFFS